MKKEIPGISEAELEVMKVLWDNGAMTSPEIVAEVSKTNDWKPKTIQTLITRLVSKDAIKSEKINQKSYNYSANISRKTYQRHANKSFLKKLYNGSLNMMLASFIGEVKLTKEEIDELKSILEDKENEF